MARFFILFFGFTLLLVFVSGCGSERSNPVSPPNEAEQLAGLPGIPTGSDDVRRGSITDNDLVTGAGFFDDEGVVIDGTVGVIAAGTAPGANLSYALYQHTARPAPAEPYMLNVLGYFQDEDPVNIDPADGYFVAVADYNLNRWVITGPHTTTMTRYEYPESANITSPAGFIYTAVIAYNGNAVEVTSVQIGYDLGVGYEQYVLPAINGSSPGEIVDIELDDSGDPQIAYFVSPSLIGNMGSEIWVAQLNGTVWETQLVPTTFNARIFDFAIGSGGRRALVATDSSSNEIHILVDTGTGDFDSDITMPLPVSTDVDPSIVFINDADDPLGLLNTALVVYGANPAGGLAEMMFCEYDGINPPAISSIIGMPTLEVRELGLTELNSKSAMVTIPVPGVPSASCEFYTYTALGDAWVPGPPIWVGLELAEPGGDGPEGVMIRELPSGDIVAGYRNINDPQFTFGVYDGALWSSEPTDTVSCAQVFGGLDMEAYSTNAIAFPTIYGSYSPVLYDGIVADGLPLRANYLSTEQHSCSRISIAIDATDAVHIAYQRPIDAQLIYNRFEAGGVTEDEIVDNGASGTSSGFGNASIVADGNIFHVFHNDLAHGQVLHSRNNNGIWEIEQRPILNNMGVPYLVIGAGLLETTGQLYVAYMDYFDFFWRVAISDENQENWNVVDVAMFMEEDFYVADNETSIVAAYVGLGVESEEMLYFETGLENALTRNKEIITSAMDLIDTPLTLAYNSFDGLWYVTSNDRNNLRSYLFRRAAPGAWQGPHLISEISFGPGARMEVCGLTCQNSDGQLMAVVIEREGGTDIWNTLVYSSALDPVNFGAPELVASYDTGVTDGSGEIVVPDADGMPVIGLVRKLTADATWDFQMYLYDAGSWSLSETWDSPVRDPLEEFPHGLTMMGNGLPAVTLVEHEDASSLFGRVFVYYPW